MEDLPKIAQQRLKQRAVGPGSGPTSPAPAGAEHPDANLLTAFAEKRLSDNERAPLLSHLAECAACREILALAVLPESAEAAPVVSVGRKPAWWVSPMVRWSAVAAALGAIVLAVMAYRPETFRFRETTVSEVQRPPAPAPAQPAQQPMPEAVSTPAKEAHADLARQKAPVRSQPSSEEARSTLANLNQAEAKHAEGAGATPATGAPAGVSTSQAALAKPGLVEGSSVGGPVQHATPPGAVVLGPGQSVTIPRAPSTAAAGAGVRSARTATDKMEQAVAVPKADFAVTRPAEAQPGAPQAPPASALVGAGSENAPSALRAAKAGAPPAGVRWSISAKGNVETSLDGGKNWEEVHLEEGVAFRAVAAAAEEIWAGGSRGAVYHSDDAGATWSRVAVSSEGRRLSDDVVGIRFSDPRRVTLTTAAGERWVTTDGGQHWEIR